MAAAAALAEDVVFAALAEFLDPAGLAQLAVSRHCYTLPAARRLLQLCERDLRTLWELEVRHRITTELCGTVHEASAAWERIEQVLAANYDPIMDTAVHMIRNTLAGPLVRYGRSRQQRRDFAQQSRIAELCRFNAALAAVACGHGVLASEPLRQQALMLRESAQRLHAKRLWIMAEDEGGWRPDQAEQAEMWSAVEQALGEFSDVSDFCIEPARAQLVLEDLRGRLRSLVHGQGA
eukprot:TRINITY_DN25141_c2_g1_i1.p1 TRINITY_DN25141_c2_g1~~TRINITY_DN25141_c2_g1_i1.p1  ORF type:complete len:260 (+),score=77.79 TRINITY_DN25141_c2_g1_i1:74-781(+)